MPCASLPIIDVSRASGVPEQLDRACREYGFFYLVGHGVDPACSAQLLELARRFFALPLQDKLQIQMAHGGAAWRGYFRLGAELTSGAPDRKEGIYFGTELGPDDPRVRAGLPLHGQNLFPAQPAELRGAVLRYLTELAAVAQRVLAHLAVGLGLDAGYFVRDFTHDPTILFRIFNYPAAADSDASWGVGEHTDYGLLTLLQQAGVSGLQVRHGGAWLDVPDRSGSLVCNVGDMLERLTRGRYLSALHRVRNTSARDRISLAFFFDPAFAASIAPIPGIAPMAAEPHTRVRWDEIALDAGATYGDYLLRKVAKVFPELSRTTRPGSAG